MIYKIRFGPARIHFVADSAPHDIEDTWSLYWLFQYQGEEAPNLRVRIRTDPPPPPVSARVIGEVVSNWQLYEDRSGYRLEVIDPVGLKPKQIALFNSTWDEVDVHMMPYAYEAPVRMRSGWVLCDLMEPLIQWWFSFWLAIRHKGLVLHASAIALEGLGLAFVGESGAGKSTLARLCSRHKSAIVLNDERIVLWRDGDIWFVGGTPWHGEYAKASPETAPLSRVCLLKKAPYEHFAPRSGAAFMMEIVSQAFLPVWSPDAMTHCLGLIDQLLLEVPSGELQFRKNPEVVAFLKGLARPVTVA